MIQATIIQKEKMLFSTTLHLIPQWGVNIEVLVKMDDYFEGYSFEWLVAYDKEMLKSDYLEYDSEKRILTIPKKALKKNGYIYITVRAIKGNEIIPCYPVGFMIDSSPSPRAMNGPETAQWEEIAIYLFQQIFDNEYKTPLEQLIETTKNGLHNILGQAKDLISDIYSRLANDEFRGQQGIQGEKGEKGDKGDQGESGVTVPANGMFTFSGDPTTGDLWCYYPDGNTPPSFETDENGNIYCVLSE